MENSIFVTTKADYSTRGVVTLPFRAEFELAKGAGTYTDSDLRKLIEHLDLYLCGGTMNSADRDGILAALIAERQRIIASGVSDAEGMQIVKGAILSTVVSPSYLIVE